MTAAAQPAVCATSNGVPLCGSTPTHHAADRSSAARPATYAAIATGAPTPTRAAWTQGLRRSLRPMARPSSR